MGAELRCAARLDTGVCTGSTRRRQSCSKAVDGIVPIIVLWVAP